MRKRPNRASLLRFGACCGDRRIKRGAAALAGGTACPAGLRPARGLKAANAAAPPFFIRLPPRPGLAQKFNQSLS